MKKYISAFLILIGVLLIASPYITKLLVTNQVDKTVEIVEEITVEQIEENNQREAVYDYSAIRDVSTTTAVVNTARFEDENIVGQLIISDLGINLPVLKGVTDANLMAGAATMVPDIRMGAGNFSLASHYMKDPKLLFGNLLNAQEGMIIQITDKNTVYEYTIYETILVPETAIYMLDEERAEERGKPIISLMTCYYTSKNGLRYFALGELTDEYPYEREELY